MLARPHSAALFALVAGSALMAADFAEAGCTLYQHRDYGGAHWALRGNDSMVMVNGEDRGCVQSHGGYCGKTYYRSAWNDQVSSFKVTPGCTLTLWQHVNNGGARMVRSNSVRYVGSAWNDQASEAECSCD